MGMDFIRLGGKEIFKGCKKINFRKIFNLKCSRKEWRGEDGVGIWFRGGGVDNRNYIENNRIGWG